MRIDRRVAIGGFVLLVLTISWQRRSAWASTTSWIYWSAVPFTLLVACSMARRWYDAAFGLATVVIWQLCAPNYCQPVLVIAVRPAAPGRDQRLQALQVGRDSARTSDPQISAPRRESPGLRDAVKYREVIVSPPLVLFPAFFFWQTSNPAGFNTAELDKARDARRIAAAMERLASQLGGPADKQPNDRGRRSTSLRWRNPIAEVAMETGDKNAARAAAENGLKAAERAVTLETGRSRISSPMGNGRAAR